MAYDRLSPMQAAVLEIPEAYNVALLGGRGGGKSTAAIFLALQHIKKYGEQADVLVVRKTFKSLQDFEEELIALLGQATGGNFGWNKADKIARVGGAKIELTAIEDRRSYERVQGSNRTLLIVEEVGQYDSERIIRLLRSNLRGPAGVITRVIYVGNPGGPLHGLLYKRHIKDRTPYLPYEVELEDGVAEEWVTVPSTVSDNVFIDVTAYVRKLREACHGDPVRLRQWLFGDWAEGSGLMFPAFRRDVHVVTLPEGFRVSRDLFRFTTATDWGLTKASCSLLGCFARRSFELASGVRAPQGSVLVVDEVTDCIFDNPEDLTRSRQWPPSLLGERIVARSAVYGVPHPNGVVDDARGLKGETLIEEMRSEGFWNLTKPRKGSRSEGYAVINSMLVAAADRDPSRPHLYIGQGCRLLLATLPNAVIDPEYPDDLLETPSCPDDAIDPLRYLLAEARQRPATQGVTTAWW